MRSALLRRLTFLLILSFILVSFFNNPPNGRTGAPGDGLCTDCHSGGGTQDGNVEISGLPGVIEAGLTYQITLTSNNPNGMATFAGFQLVTLNSSNNDAGTLNNASSGSTITPSGGRTYWEHNPAQSFGASTSVSWTVDWTAPAGPDGEEITMYAASNVANGNGSSSGDLIVTTNVSGTLEDAGPPLSVDITTSGDVSCAGESDGTATAEATGGSMPYDFEWSNGETNPIATMLPGGLATVTVTDNLGSTATASVIIAEPTLLGLDLISSSDVSCNGDADGSATVMGSGGTPGYSYAWSDGQNGPTAMDLTAGSITVTVTDANDCTSSLEVIIIEPDALSLVFSDITDVSCFGLSDGSATAQGVGGTPGYTYDWSDGQSGPTALGLPGGIIGVTVTDNNLCEFSDIVNINEPQLLALSILNSSDVSCFGLNDGSAEVEAQGGTGPYSYQWPDGSGQSVNTMLTAGQHVVTVTDNNNCTAEIGVDILQPDSLDISLDSSQEPSCNGDADGSIQVSVNGGTPPYDYTWSDGTNADSLSGISAGTYGLTVEDNNGCNKNFSFTLDEPDAIMIDLNTTDETSSGAEDGTASVDPVGGTPGYSVMWSTGESGEMISGLAPGSYSVTVTDANMCEEEESFSIGAFGCALDVSGITTDPACFDGMDGSIFLMITGETGIVTIEWNNGADTDTLEGLGAGDYSVTVSDEANCNSTIDFSLMEPDELVIQTSSTDVSAPGEADGTASVEADGGIEPYRYLWNTGDTTDGIMDLDAGTYTITVTDANGCVDSAEVTINEANCVLEIDSMISNVSCYGSANGSICIMASGGVTPYVYDWDDGTSDSCIVDLVAGSYVVTVSDASGCQIIKTYNVIQPDSLTVEPAVADVACFGDASGSIQLSVLGGTPDYSINWSNDSTGQDVTGLQAGSYSYTVTDDNSCTKMGDLAITEPDSLYAIVDSTRNSSGGLDDGAIYITVIGGTSPVTVSWSDSEGNPVGGAEDLLDVVDGYYTVELTDELGCSYVRDSIRVGVTTSVFDPDYHVVASAFPNPSDDLIRLSIQSERSTTLRYQIISSNGELVRQTILTGVSNDWNVKVPIQGLTKGVYYVRCITKDEVLFLTFVKI